jgi:hypothetical protein
MTVEQLQIEIEALPSSDFVRVRKWFIERDWEKWDQQLESNVASGKLDFLVDQAMGAKSQSKLREL